MHRSPFEVETPSLRCDLLRRTACYEGRPVRLCHREFDLLLHLLLRSPEVVSRGELLREVCRIGFDPGTNVIEVHVSRLRAKLAESGAEGLIDTVRGAGYRLTERLLQPHSKSDMARTQKQEKARFGAAE